MSNAASAAFYTTDVQVDRIRCRFDALVVVFVNRKASRMTAGTLGV